MNIFQKNKRRYKAFTLAEVLITLAIIGVVVAITIPIIMNDVKDAQYKTAYKKAFSDASNIWQSMRVNNEIASCTDRFDNSCPYVIFDTFKKYMNISVDCGTNLVPECWNVTGESYFEVITGGASTAPTKPAGNNARGFIDNSGRSWIMLTGGFAGKRLSVDTNGFKPPNKFGKDRFMFYPVTPDDLDGAGIPIKLLQAPDRTSITMDCGYPPCNGTSWLYK